MAKELEDNSQNRYKALIEKIFFNSYKTGVEEIEFEREDLPRAAKALGVQLPKNLGDVVYSIRYRTPMPTKVLSTQPKGMSGLSRALDAHAIYLSSLKSIESFQIQAW